METANALPAYVPWRTFLTAIDILEQGLPTKIDKSVFPTFAGSTQTEVLQAFKFLGLIDEDFQTTPALSLLVEDKERRPDVVRDVVTRSYKRVFDQDPARMSPAQLDAIFRDLGVSGATLVKATRFFLKAAEFAGISVSPHLTRKMRSRKDSNGQTPRRRRPAKAAGPSVADQAASPSPVRRAAGAHGHGLKDVALRSGGTITLSISVDLFGLSADDRTFVFDLIDKLKEYEDADTA